jgi:signal transduction histidine kinase
MLRESSAAVNRLARKGEVTLERTVDENLCTIVSDEGKLRQVLYNFLAFAIHRSPPGGRVRIEARRAMTDANDESSAPRIHIEIIDEGETLADPAHIFEPTDTGHAPGEIPNDRGTNMDELGLAISHRLISVLNGTVELHSGGECGLRVRLTFPQLPPAAGVLE